MDAFDKKEAAAARRVLEEARKLDPGSEAIRLFLSKLPVDTAKFKVIGERYYPSINPAFLGLLQVDRLDLSFSGPLGQIQETGDYQFLTGDARGSPAYQFPVGRNLGMGVEAMLSYSTNFVYRYSNGATDQTGYLDLGGIYGVGWAPAEVFSIGAGVSVFYQGRYRGVPPKLSDRFVRQAFILGALLRNGTGSATADLSAGFPLDSLVYLDLETGDTWEVQAPAFAEAGLTVALLNHRLFLIFRSMNDLAFDRAYYFGRLLGAVEIWASRWLALHVAAEGSLGLLETETRWGWGGNAGLTVRIPAKGWEADGGYSHRKRPSRVIPGQLAAESFYSAGVAKSDLWISRR